ncbi:unnamed protein product [Adineta ricciae]|uniref:Cytochrome P450 n=1 Tax=Adineta ricciae TaxID=249248 RepID=A0A814K0M2_ADIRI|nr:unnamed protein product [Adineta ricciae]CAF1221613.1 unnamed protein product [Adineta ricciae]
MDTTDRVTIALDTQLPSYLLSTTLTIVAFYFAYKLFKYSCQTIHFPGPKGSWYNGNLKELLADNAHEYWVKWNREYGQIFEVHSSCFSRLIFVGNPEVINHLCLRNYLKDEKVYNGFKYLSGNGLFSQLDPVQWKKQRSALAPSFSHANVYQQHHIMQEYMNILIEKLDLAIEQKKLVNISNEITLITIDFLGEIAFGQTFDALKLGENCLLMQLLQSILPELIKCAVFPLRGQFPILRVTRKMHEDIKKLRSICQASIKTAREMDESDRLFKKERIFEILATTKSSNGQYVFSEKELIDNYVTFLVAGGDPTASAITFALYELCRTENEQILRKAQEEVDELLDGRSDLINEHDLNKLKYLDMIIKETLRLHGPGFGTIRKLKENLTVNGITLPKNTSLYIWNYPVHRDPRIWSEPDIFNPENFRNVDAGEVKMNGSYFPFSHGPRKCLGLSLAMAEMRFILATFIHRYHFRLADNFKMIEKSSFTLCPSNGLPVYITKRI